MHTLRGVGWTGGEGVFLKPMTEPPPRLPDPFRFTHRGQERVEPGGGGGVRGGNIRVTEREKTKWRSGLALRRGVSMKEEERAFMEMPPAFCSAPMEEQLLISAWPWRGQEQNTHLIRSPTGHQ